MAIPAFMFNFAVDMPRLPKIIHKTLSVRLSLMVVSSMAILLLASLVVMMIYARKALREEALQKAALTLEYTSQHIDNIMLSVEQSAGNFYFHLLPEINNKEKILTYSRQLVESNPFVVGCAIAYTPGYFKDGECFMAYYHRNDKSEIVRSETFANESYTEQIWFAGPMKSGQAGWTKPLSEDSSTAALLSGQRQDASLADKGSGQALTVITFCLPVYSMEGKPVAIMGIDVSLSLLSNIILNSKPSEHSYCTLLDRDGSYIVHPDSNKLFHQSIYSLAEQGADPSLVEAGMAMVSGETGYRPFRMDGKDYFVFFKPFTRTYMPARTEGELGWSAGIVYPEEDIFGDYNNLRYYVLGISVVGLLLLLLLCRNIIHHQLLPLRTLTKSAQRIAEGEYDEVIPDSRQKDEIGRLQSIFRRMQLSLAAHVGELEQLTKTLQERGKGLNAAYERAQKADRMKTAFLHNMTNQMIVPADIVVKDVESLLLLSPADVTPSPDGKMADRAALAEDIREKGETIAKLLDDLIKISDEDYMRRPQATAAKEKGGQP